MPVAGVDRAKERVGGEVRERARGRRMSMGSTFMPMTAADSGVRISCDMYLTYTAVLEWGGRGRGGDG
jgi:hypothetical protein